MEREVPRPLDDRLERITATLKASLDEACGTDVQRLDTSESVRIEEVLAIASEAAKEMVTLRRKKRHSKHAPPGGESAPAASPVVDHRPFVDERNVAWDAFAVLPTADPRGLSRLPQQYQQGWLCFESATEKRRLGPIPDQWQTATDGELRGYLDAAQVVPQRATPLEPRDRL